MDAKVGDWVVTPRRGKPVEIQALWYNALRLMATWAQEFGEAPEEFLTLAQQTQPSFNHRFWFADGQYLFDVSRRRSMAMIPAFVPIKFLRFLYDSQF